MKKRLIALLLVLCVAFAIFPVAAHATTTDSVIGTYAGEDAHFGSLSAWSPTPFFGGPTHYWHDTLATGLEWVPTEFVKRYAFTQLGVFPDAWALTSEANSYELYGRAAAVGLVVHRGYATKVFPESGDIMCWDRSMQGFRGLVGIVTSFDDATHTAHVLVQGIGYAGIDATVRWSMVPSTYGYFYCYNAVTGWISSPF